MEKIVQSAVTKFFGKNDIKTKKINTKMVNVFANELFIKK